GGLEQPSQPGELEDEVDQRPVRRRGDAERPAGGQPPDRLLGARDQRQALAVARLHPLDHLGRDLVRRLRPAHPLLHVPPPLRPPQPILRARRPGVVPAAAPRAERLAHAVPDLLRLDQDAAEVEDDRLDHTVRYPDSMWTSGGAGWPSSTDSTSPTKSVWSPT